ncbi:hydrogenase maturation nickel metallochaperone HypA [bacterium]|nr:hydrogenase maturation nickel metallochaperone HypA [bacterium]
MHEMSIAENIIRVAEDNIPDGDYVVTEIKLKIGKLSGVVPEALSFSFEIITQNTPFEETVLTIESIPAVGHCEDCDNEFEIDTISFICPKCGSTKVKLVSGREMLVNSIEIEEIDD